MNVLRTFDPWRNPLCTCPDKYSLSPYTGCDIRCLYCYITAYIPRGFRCRAKGRFIERLLTDLRRAERALPISIANSSDPYPKIEERLRLTEATLRVLLSGSFKVLLVTKSDLVLRDLNLIRRGRCSVSMTITTLDPAIAKRLEPGAPSPERRLRAIKELTRSGVPCSVRIDPIIPQINDGGIGNLVKAVADAGARHVVSSTFKAKPDSLTRIVRAFPELSRNLISLYRERGELKPGRAWYLPKDMRIQILREAKEAAADSGMTHATCREALGSLTTGRTCDGSHLIPGRPQLCRANSTGN
ncbi:MAG: radical SAM protein [Candidatus Bathyarchaeia archaeon]